MEDFQERIACAAQKTWQAIGGDILTAAQADSISREEVVEVVMDSIADYGGDAEAVAEFKPLDFEQKRDMLTKAFPLARYGW